MKPRTLVVGVALLVALVAVALSLVVDAHRVDVMTDIRDSAVSTDAPAPVLPGTQQGAPAGHGEAAEDCDWQNQPTLAFDETSSRSIEAAVGALTTSSDPDLLFGAALLAQGEAMLRETGEWDEQAMLLNRARTIAPQHRMLLWHTLIDCARSDCDRAAAEADAVRVDADNGYVWLQIAIAGITEDRWDDAEAALMRAATTTRFDTYFMEYAVAVEKALAAGSDLDYVNRIVTGMAHAAAVALPNLRTVTNACSEDRFPASIPASTCDTLGQQMIDGGRDILTVAIGNELRRIAAERDGKPALANRFSREKKALSQRLVASMNNSDAYALQVNDPAVLRRYVDNYLTHGEIRAMELLVMEAERLRADPTYDQCNFVGAVPTAENTS